MRVHVRGTSVEAHGSHGLPLLLPLPFDLPLPLAGALVAAATASAASSASSAAAAKLALVSASALTTALAPASILVFASILALIFASMTSLSAALWKRSTAMPRRLTARILDSLARHSCAASPACVAASWRSAAERGPNCQPGY
eukprot:scaffold14245_cov52-Phaeocystis_antarctica.AAC.4